MVGEGGGREGRGQGIRRGGRGHSPFPLPPVPTLVQGPRGVARGKEGRPGSESGGAAERIASEGGVGI